MVSTPDQRAYLHLSPTAILRHPTVIVTREINPSIGSPTGSEFCGSTKAFKPEDLTQYWKHSWIDGRSQS